MTGAAYPDWDSVYRDNVTWVYRQMYRKVGNQPDAEDLTAEVFMTALRPLRMSATVPEVRKYLHMTARSVLASYWKDRMGRQITSIDDEDLPASSEPEQVAGTREPTTLPCHSTSFSLEGTTLTHQLPTAPPLLPKLAVRESNGVIEVFAPMKST